MPIAQDMKSLADKIVGDYDARISVLGNIVADTHDTLKGFNRDRVKMGAQQRKDLAQFAADLAASVAKKLKELQKEHKEMAEALEEALKTGETSRLKDFKAMLNGIQKRIGDIEKDVSQYLSEVRKDMGGATEAWQKMTGEMGKLRHGVAIRIGKGKPISAGVEVKTAEEAAPKKRGKRRGRPGRK